MDKRGGKRNGAGRKPIGSARAISVSITLTPEDIEYLKSIHAALSVAIRELIRRDRQK